MVYFHCTQCIQTQLVTQPQYGKERKHSNGAIAFAVCTEAKSKSMVPSTM